MSDVNLTSFAFAVRGLLPARSEGLPAPLESEALAKAQPLNQAAFTSFAVRGFSHSMKIESGLRTWPFTASNSNDG